MYNHFFLSATEGVDYMALDMVVTLTQGETRPCFDIVTINDDVVEASEDVAVSLSDANGVTIGMGGLRISIADDGFAPISIFSVITLGFMSTTLSGREGDLVSVCVEVQSGSVQRPSLSVELAVTDITTSGMFSYSIFTKMSTLILLHYIGVSYYIRFFTYYSLFENFYFRVF